MLGVYLQDLIVVSNFLQEDGILFLNIMFLGTFQDDWNVDFVIDLVSSSEEKPPRIPPFPAGKSKGVIFSSYLSLLGNSS